MRMTRNLQLRGLGACTQEDYLRAVRQLAAFYRPTPNQFNEEQLRGLCCSWFAGADANAETHSRLRAVRRAWLHTAFGSAGRLEPPVNGCQSGYQDAAEDLGDREYGEDQ